MKLHNISHIYHLSTSFIRESVIPPLTPQQKRIAAIAFTILSGFAMIFILYGCFKNRKATHQNQEEENFGINALSPHIKLPDPEAESLSKAVIPTFETIEEGENENKKLRIVENVTDKMFFESLFQHNKGVFLADNHADISNIQYLISNMALFAQLGVKHLYIEKNREALAQYDLFNDCTEGDEAYIAFLEYFKKSQKSNIQFYPGFTCMLMALLIEAKRHDIKLKPIDTNICLDENMAFTPDGDILGLENKIRRAESSNKEWVKAIKQDNQDLKDQDKFIVFGGGGHAKEFESIRGVSEILGIPTVNFMNQHLHPWLKQEQAFVPLTPKYRQYSKQADFTLIAQPSPFNIDTKADLNEFILPVKEYRFNQLFKEFERKIKDKFQSIEGQISLQYKIGKETIENEMSGERYLQFIDKRPFHSIVISGLEAKDKEELIQKLTNQWQKECDSNDVRINCLITHIQDLKIEVSSNSLFEAILKELI